jgi:hypothetical protein
VRAHATVEIGRAGVGFDDECAGAEALCRIDRPGEEGATDAAAQQVWLNEQLLQVGDLTRAAHLHHADDGAAAFGHLNAGSREADGRQRGVGAACVHEFFVISQYRLRSQAKRRQRL